MNESLLQEVCRIAMEKRKEREDFTKSLGPPWVLFTSGDTIGIWKSESGGAVTYRKLKNGTFDRYTRADYPELFIKGLASCLEKEHL